MTRILTRSLVLIVTMMFLIPGMVVAQGPCALSGNYTINSAAVTGGTNFQTFNDLAATLTSCGVSGHVTVTVVPGSGPYNEQVKFNWIPGIGPNATVTLYGSGETIGFLTTATYRHIIRLANLQYFAIRNLKINRDNSATSGFMGVHLFGSATNITIDSVEVDMGTTTSTLVGGIIASGDSASILAAGSYHNVNVTNCKTMGGGYGVSFYGLAADLSTGVEIRGNTLLDVNSNGVYLRETDGTHVANNNIRIKGGNGIQLAQSANINGLIEKNVVSALSTVTTTIRGIYVFQNNPAQPHKIINNIVHQMNAPGAVIYAYTTRTGGGLFYNNTAILDDNTATSTGLTAGFYEELSSSGSVLKNNIFYITRSSTGNKAGIVLGSTTNISTGITTDYNVFYIPSGNIVTKNPTTPTHYPTLAVWNTASNQDMNSFSTDPQFVTGTAIPSSTIIDNEGVSIPLVTDDITGAPRSATPDPGAYEFPQVTVDAMLQAFDQPVNNSCGSAAQTVSVVVKNNGVSAITNVPVAVQITGALNTTLTTTYSGTIAPSASETVSVGVINTLAGGTYDMKAYTSLAGDINANNDTLEVTFNVNAIPMADAGLDNQICSGMSDTLITTTLGTSYEWSTGATTQAIIVSPAVTTTYTLTVSNGSCSSTDEVTIYVNPTPVLITDTDVEVCNGSSITLTVTGADTYVWSHGPTVGSIVVSPSTTTDYYVTGMLTGGCTDTDTITVTVNTLPTVQMSSLPQIICTNTPYMELTGTPAGGVFTGPGVSNDTLYTVNAGNSAGMDTPFNVIYVYTDANGCTNSDTVQTEVSLCTLIEESMDELISVYPSPFEHSITLSLNGTSIVNVMLYSIDGSLINVEKYTSGTTMTITPEKSLASGVYFISVQTGDRIFTKRIVKN